MQVGITYSMHVYASINAGAIALFRVYPEPYRPMSIIDLNCTGNEFSVFDCPHNSLTDRSCYTNNDAGVVCQSKGPL